MPQVRASWYESKAEAYQTFKQRMAGQPGVPLLTKAGHISPSIRVDLVRHGDFDKVVQALKGSPGVDQIIEVHRVP